ncbi:MAG: hypothetical protein ACR2QB_05220 [Gammaproteobacteria bacterium]
MYELFKVFGSIVLRRLGPEDLPSSGFLLGLTAAIYVLAQIPVALPAFGTVGNVASALAVDLSLMVACLWALLRVTGYGSRYQQTLTALLGTSALLSLASVPFTLWLLSSADAPVGSTAFPNAMILAIIIWSLVVNGHILGRALSRSFGIGLLVAITYFFLQSTLLSEFISADP